MSAELECDFLDGGVGGRELCGEPASLFYERRPRPGVPPTIQKDCSLWAARCPGHQLSPEGTKSREHIPCTEDEYLVGKIMDS